ncbi:hypothetical protein BCR44DRAFT_1442904, partial [Catenaria anguillulae PL171]
MMNTHKMQAYASELATALAAVHAASLITARVQAALVPTTDAIAKVDKSPVTVADFAAQAVVSYYLAQSPDTRATSFKVVVAIREGMLHVPAAGAVQPNEWLDLIDRASSARNPPACRQAGFLRHQQFAVCLALLEDNQVKVGVLGCPNLSSNNTDKSSQTAVGTTGTMFWAVKGQGAWQMDLSHAPDEYLQHSTRISTTSPTGVASPIMLESYESSHSNHELSSSIAAHLNITSAPMRMDSQCKYAQVARGQGHLYLRILRDVEYKERIWDHAAGSLIVTEAGGKVTDLVGEELKFKPSGALDENVGIVATGGGSEWHDKVLEAVRLDQGVAPYLQVAKRVAAARTSKM